MNLILIKIGFYAIDNSISDSAMRKKRKITVVAVPNSLASLRLPTFQIRIPRRPIISS